MMNLKHIDAIPLPYRVVFSEFICFNRMQSQVLDAILHSGKYLYQILNNFFNCFANFFVLFIR